MSKIPWGPIRSSLVNNFSFGLIKEIVGYADIDMSKLAHLEQRSQGGASKSQLLSAIDQQIGGLGEKQQSDVASICCEEMLIRRPDLEPELERVLSRVGWKFQNNRLLPIDVFDISELLELPEQAHEDLLKAATRLRDGDLSGSLSASCGAIDSVTLSIYQEFSLGDPHKASFQERISQSIKAIGAQEDLEKELHAISWPDSDVTPFIKNFSGSLNQAAFIMQKLRSAMGDVHGSKPVIKSVIYDSIKWSALILRVLAVRKGF